MDWLTAAVTVGAVLGSFGALYTGYLSAREDRRREQTLLRSVELVETVRRETEEFLRDDGSDANGDADHGVNAESLARAILQVERRVARLETERTMPTDGSDELEFRRLWDEAQARLAKYHELAVIQGRQSFRMLLVFSALGFALLAFVVWRATTVDTTAGGIALGAASAAGGALTAYISRTFMRAYRDANERLVDYFAEPLDMSRLLASERLLKNIDSGSRDDATRRIIESTLMSQVSVSQLSRSARVLDDSTTPATTP